MTRSLKVIIIITLMALLAGIGYWIWNAYFRGAPAPGEETLALPEGAAGEITPQIRRLSGRDTFDYWLTAEGDIYIVADDGQIYKLTAGGEENVSSQIIGGLHSVNAAVDGSAAIFAFGYPFEKMFSIFNVRTKSWASLPPGTTAADWDPKSANRIAYLTGGSAGGLNIFNVGAKQSSAVARLTQSDQIIDWVLPNIVYIADKPTEAFPGSAWSVDLSTKRVRPLIRQVGLLLNWSTDGKLGLISDSAANLSLINEQAHAMAKINGQTIADKCAFSKTDIYCAVPDIGSSAIRLDDYLQKSIYTEDRFYKFSLEFGPERLNDFSEIIFGSVLAPIPLDAIRLTPAGNTLYFINRYDQRLYSLNLEA